MSAGSDRNIGNTAYFVKKYLHIRKIPVITLAYAMTVHKSQGSEADCVVTCLCPFHKEMAVRNIPYTAFSRGKKELLFVGDVNTLKKAIETVRANRRITTLSEEIKYYGGDFVAA